MHRGTELNPEDFERMLSWLGPDRDVAGRKYEEIRQRLIKIFTCRGCFEPEELADETITRGANKVAKIENGYVGDPAVYFYAIARNVYLEYTRRQVYVPPSPEPTTFHDQQQQDCLERCLLKLSSADRDLILSYYRDDGREKIEHRRNLALELGIAVNALRIKVCRVRKFLYDCVVQCVQQVAAAEMDPLSTH